MSDENLTVPDYIFDQLLDEMDDFSESQKNIEKTHTDFEKKVQQQEKTIQKIKEGTIANPIIFPTEKVRYAMIGEFLFAKTGDMIQRAIKKRNKMLEKRYTPKPNIFRRMFGTLKENTNPKSWLIFISALVGLGAIAYLLRPMFGDIVDFLGKAADKVKEVWTKLRNDATQIFSKSEKEPENNLKEAIIKFGCNLFDLISLEMGIDFSKYEEIKKKSQNSMKQYQFVSDRMFLYQIDENKTFSVYKFNGEDQKQNTKLEFTTNYASQVFNNYNRRTQELFGVDSQISQQIFSSFGVNAYLKEHPQFQEEIINGDMWAMERIQKSMAIDNFNKMIKSDGSIEIPKEYQENQELLFKDFYDFINGQTQNISKDKTEFLEKTSHKFQGSEKEQLNQIMAYAISSTPKNTEEQINMMIDNYQKFFDFKFDITFEDDGKINTDVRVPENKKTITKTIKTKQGNIPYLLTNIYSNPLQVEYMKKTLDTEDYLIELENKIITSLNTLKEEIING